MPTLTRKRLVEVRVLREKDGQKKSARKGGWSRECVQRPGHELG